MPMQTGVQRSSKIDTGESNSGGVLGTADKKPNKRINLTPKSSASIVAPLFGSSYTYR